MTLRSALKALAFTLIGLLPYLGGYALGALLYSLIPGAVWFGVGLGFSFFIVALVAWMMIDSARTDAEDYKEALDRTITRRNALRVALSDMIELAREGSTADMAEAVVRIAEAEAVLEDGFVRAAPRYVTPSHYKFVGN